MGTAGTAIIARSRFTILPDMGIGSPTASSVASYFRGGSVTLRCNLGQIEKPTIRQERERNPRLGGEKTLEEFKDIMAHLNLPYPKKIDAAVPANRFCGDRSEAAVEALHGIGGSSLQG